MCLAEESNGVKRLRRYESKLVARYTYCQEDLLMALLRKGRAATLTNYVAVYIRVTLGDGSFQRRGKHCDVSNTIFVPRPVRSEILVFIDLQAGAVSFRACAFLLINIAS